MTCCVILWFSFIILLTRAHTKGQEGLRDLNKSQADIRKLLYSK